MSAPVRLVCGETGRAARLSEVGQLIVSPYDYDQSVYKELAEPDTAYNFYSPRAGERFVITGIRAKADRQVSAATDADVVVYEATGSSVGTIQKTLYQEAMIQGESVTLLPLNLLVSEGVYVNAKTSDDDVHMTIFGYYRPA